MTVDQSINFIPERQNNINNWIALLDSSLEPWSQSNLEDGQPHVFLYFPSSFSVLFLLLQQFQIVFQCYYLGLFPRESQGLDLTPVH